MELSFGSEIHKADAVRRYKLRRDRHQHATTALLRRTGDVDNKAQTERGEGRLDVLHARSVAEVEHAVDLRQVPA